jgi:hypothetical protein
MTTVILFFLIHLILSCHHLVSFFPKYILTSHVNSTRERGSESQEIEGFPSILLELQRVQGVSIYRGELRSNPIIGSCNLIPYCLIWYGFQTNWSLLTLNLGLVPYLTSFMLLGAKSPRKKKGCRIPYRRVYKDTGGMFHITVCRFESVECAC